MSTKAFHPTPPSRAHARGEYNRAGTLSSTLFELRMKVIGRPGPDENKRKRNERVNKRDGRDGGVPCTRARACSIVGLRAWGREKRDTVWIGAETGLIRLSWAVLAFPAVTCTNVVLNIVIEIKLEDEYWKTDILTRSLGCVSLRVFGRRTLKRVHDKDRDNFLWNKQ